MRGYYQQNTGHSPKGITAQFLEMCYRLKKIVAEEEARGTRTMQERVVGEETKGTSRRGIVQNEVRKCNNKVGIVDDIAE